MLDPKSTSIRAASGAVYILIIVLACWWGAFGVMLLACLFGALGIYEFRKMNFPDNPGGGGLAIYDVIGGLVLIFTGDILLFPAPLIIWIVWLLGRMVLTVFSKRDHPEREFAIDIMAQIYVSLPLAIMTVAAQFSEEVNSHLNYNSSSHCLPILAVFILIWINDTGAFIFGSSFGRHKLYERVSPKKSWEGFWGGCLCCIAAGAAIGAFFPALAGGSFKWMIWFWIGAGAVISVAATFGDLFESVIKRNLNMKDSGHLIPGHGCILDRIDSLLMVIPAMALYCILFSVIIN